MAARCFFFHFSCFAGARSLVVSGMSCEMRWSPCHHPIHTYGPTSVSHTSLGFHNVKVADWNNRGSHCPICKLYHLDWLKLVGASDQNLFESPWKLKLFCGRGMMSDVVLIRGFEFLTLLIHSEKYKFREIPLSPYCLRLWSLALNRKAIHWLSQMFSIAISLPAPKNGFDRWGEQVLPPSHSHLRISWLTIL